MCLEDDKGGFTVALRTTVDRVQTRGLEGKEFESSFPTCNQIEKIYIYIYIYIYI